LVATAVVGRDQRRLNMPSVAARTITVDTEPVGVLEFWAGSEQKEVLLRNGQEAARKFLETWDWDAYRREHRPERRE
jgi:NTE family protein